MTNSNPGYAFPLEKLGSDLARNDFNYQSILNGLVEWNNTTDTSVKIRLTKDTDPWFEDYSIPSKKSLFDLNANASTAKGIISGNCFALDSMIDAALYGGSRKYTIRQFDGFANISGANIMLTDYASLLLGDRVKFSYPGATSVIGTTAIDASKLYFIVNNPQADTYVQISETETGSTLIMSPDAGIGAITLTKYEESPESSTTDPGDIVAIRSTVANNGVASWQCWYSRSIHNWTSGQPWRFGEVVRHLGVLYECSFDVTNSTVAPVTDAANFTPLYKQWVSAAQFFAGDLVIDPANSVYLALKDMNGTQRPSSDVANYSLEIPLWTATTEYKKGAYAFHAASKTAYVALQDINTSPALPSTDDRWQAMVLSRVPGNDVAFTTSKVVRWQINQDVSGFVLRNAGHVSSTASTDLGLRISARTKEPNSIYQRTTGFFPTSNYSFWPDYANAVWESGATYGPTDTSRSIDMCQEYSATMVFDHTNLEVTKTINYVNYDGPDLDQGLCIYLPVAVDVADSGVAFPEDGFTFEFFFRIWPSTVYTQAVTADHIVNKSQVYVYSAANKSEIGASTCGTPIAKFSMARTTNYYVFAENISIPDKPVCYRATFVYSSARQEWTLTDYYQLPDHLFIGPVGFIDPQNPANLDVNGVGTGNPNPVHIGYETAALPLFQDPFSNSDLSPYRLAKDGTEYIKRILE